MRPGQYDAAGHQTLDVQLEDLFPDLDDLNVPYDLALYDERVFPIVTGGAGAKRNVTTRVPAGTRDAGPSDSPPEPPEAPASPVFSDERLPDRFWQRVEPNPDGCWVWIGGTCQKDKDRGSDYAGYGRFPIEAISHGRGVLAHRFAYEHLVGAIPGDLVIDHLCRNQLCVNPAHLEPVTQTENKLRGDSPPARNARKTHCLRGHEFTAENTRFMVDGSRRCRICQRALKNARRANARASLPPVTPTHEPSPPGSLAAQLLDDVHG